MSKNLTRLLDEVYVSADIETDGPIPGPHSMLSMGFVAFTLRQGIIGEYSVNLYELPGARMDPDTKTEFWDRNPEAWARCRENPVPPHIAMAALADWLQEISPERQPVFVGYPAGFDFTFVYWYAVKYLGKSPFGFQAFDIKTYAAAALGVSFRNTTKKTMPARWFEQIDTVHSHVAVEDAREQAQLCIAMMRDHLRDKLEYLD